MRGGGWRTFHGSGWWGLPLHPSLVYLDWSDQEGLGETGVSWGSVCPAVPYRGELHPHFNLLLLLWAPHTCPVILASFLSISFLQPLSLILLLSILA